MQSFTILLYPRGIIMSMIECEKPKRVIYSIDISFIIKIKKRAPTSPQHL